MLCHVNFFPCYSQQLWLRSSTESIAMSPAYPEPVTPSKLICKDISLYFTMDNKRPQIYTIMSNEIWRSNIITTVGLYDVYRSNFVIKTDHQPD